jgi:hypothetical protein
MSSWNTTTKLFFRLGFIYFLLYVFPFPIGWIPFTEFIQAQYYNAWLGPANWIGKNILSIPYEITILPNGSGDTTFDYVLIFIFLVIAVAGTIVWIILDSKRTHYEKLWYWFIVVLRYYLGVVLLAYGFVKIIQTQFPAPSLETMLQSYGESTPMKLLWTFMGYSKEYNFFIGLTEATSGMLLFFRRTRLLGALLSIAVMSNVVVLNFCYDVPVKLLSTHLLVISVILLLLDIKRLVAFFILNKTVAPVPVQSVYRKPWEKTLYIAAKVVFIGGFLLIYIGQGVMRQAQLSQSTENGTALYGVYDVQEFILNGDTLPPVTTDTRRWKRMYIRSAESVDIQYMDGASIRWTCQIDTVHHAINLASMGAAVGTLYNYEVSHNTMIMTGGEPRTMITFLVKNHDNFPLLNGQFNWINEYPNNR